jgi:hypothetical protein
MSKKLLPLILLTLLLVLFSACSSAAQGEIVVLSNTAEVNYPLDIVFHLDVESTSTVTDIRLCYTTDRITTAKLITEVFPKFTPADKVSAGWSLQMKKIGGLPPGANIQYWWKIKDSSNHYLETIPKAVKFNDARYSWSKITDGEVSLFWHKGSDSFARELMDTAQQTLSKLSNDTGAQLERSVKIYIYANQTELLDALMFPQKWTGGVAFTQFGIIAIPIDPAAERAALSWGKRTIAHELTHLVTYQMTFNPYNDIPLWLNEGLSVYSEGELDANRQFLLYKAIARDELISVHSLCGSFPTDYEQALLAYAESYSLVEFLITSYGSDRMLQLLTTFKRGSTYNGALEEAYSFDVEGLDSRWRAAISSTVPGTSWRGFDIKRDAMEIGTTVVIAGVGTFRPWEELGVSNSLGAKAG